MTQYVKHIKLTELNFDVTFPHQA